MSKRRLDTDPSADPLGSVSQGTWSTTAAQPACELIIASARRDFVRSEAQRFECGEVLVKGWVFGVATRIEIHAVNIAEVQDAHDSLEQRWAGDGLHGIHVTRRLI